MERSQQCESIPEGNFLIDEMAYAWLVNALLTLKIAPVRDVHEDLVQGTEVSDKSFVWYVFPSHTVSI
jgi:hypothetical protein